MPLQVGHIYNYKIQVGMWFFRAWPWGRSTQNTKGPTGVFLINDLYSCVQKEAITKKTTWSKKPSDQRIGLCFLLCITEIHIINIFTGKEQDTNQVRVKEKGEST